MFKATLFLCMCVVASFAQLSFNQQSASLQQARYSHGCVNLNGTAYVLGGTIGEVFTSSVEYLSSNGSWIYNPTFMPTARSSAAYLAYQGRYIFAIGGSVVNTSFPQPSTTVEVFDSVNNNWTTVAPLNSARSYLYAFLFYTVNPVTNVTVENIAVIGGDVQNGVNSTYELATVSYINGTLSVSNWVSHPSSSALLNAQLQTSTVVETVDTIYFLGGIINSNQSLTSVHSLNKTVFSQSPTTAPVIQVQTSLATPQFGASGAVMESNEQIYLFGGAMMQTYETSVNTSYVYNATTNSTAVVNITYNYPVYWSNVISLTSNGSVQTWVNQSAASAYPVLYSCAVAANGEVYVTGGVHQNIFVNATDYVIGNLTIYSSVQALYFPNDASSSSHGLSNGAIAGIVIGSLVGVAIIVGIIVFITKRGKRTQYREV